MWLVVIIGSAAVLALLGRSRLGPVYRQFPELAEPRDDKLQRGRLSMMRGEAIGRAQLISPLEHRDCIGYLLVVGSHRRTDCAPFTLKTEAGSVRITGLIKVLESEHGGVSLQTVGSLAKTEKTSQQEWVIQPGERVAAYGPVKAPTDAQESEAPYRSSQVTPELVGTRRRPVLVKRL